MSAFYNECDPFAAAWLRNLIAAGHIAPGIVDERPIQEIKAFELMHYTQCHFFAGIGVWSYALRQAGWSDDRPIWTGSCPCQPFSGAGKQKGFKDDRHLWPYWKPLIEQCKPSIVIGEQVASALQWLDLVQTDMEGSGYAFGASDLCAAGFSGAHIRQRLYFVGLADNYNERQFESASGEFSNQKYNSQSCDDFGGLADTDEQGSGRRGVQGSGKGISESHRAALERSAGFCEDSRTNAPLLGRDAVDWLYCRDGKWRPVEPGTFPLAHEAPQRVGRLRAYGNALDAETATNFCKAVKEIADEIGV